MSERLRRVRIPLVTAEAMIFIFVSSGAFGIEDMVSSSGPGLTLLLLLVLPLVWALPMALVCSELGSALPEEGGYYAWTRRALGLLAGPVAYVVFKKTLGGRPDQRGDNTEVAGRASME